MPAYPGIVGSQLLLGGRPQSLLSCAGLLACNCAWSTAACKCPRGCVAISDAYRSESTSRPGSSVRRDPDRPCRPRAKGCARMARRPRHASDDDIQTVVATTPAPSRIQPGRPPSTLPARLRIRAGRPRAAPGTGSPLPWQSPSTCSRGSAMTT